MPITDGSVPKFGALIREAFAVLAAILVAFALDAWWDERVGHAEMLEALDAVEVEIERNLVLIDSTLTFNSSRGELIGRMLQMDPSAIDARFEPASSGLTRSSRPRARR